MNYYITNNIINNTHGYGVWFGYSKFDNWIWYEWITDYNILIEHSLTWYEL